MKSVTANDGEFKLSATHQAVLLILIVLLAALLRLYKLGAWSFWGDELITVNRALLSFKEGISLAPLSLFLTYLTLDWLGTSEWTARFIPMLAGVISIPILFFPMRKIFGPVVALLAVLLLAVSPWHLYWSQNARFYSMLLLFYTLALLTFYLGIEEDRPWYLLLSTLFLGLAALERLTSLLLIPVIVSYLALIILLPFEKPAGLRIRNLALFFLPGFFAGLYIALPLLRDPSIWQSTMTWINNNPFWIFAGVVYYIGVPTICIGGLGGLYFLLKKDRAALLLLLGAIVPLVAIMVISLFQYTANRYIFIALTSWLILAAMGAKELFFYTPKSARLLAVGALAILLLAPLSDNFLYYRYQNGNRDDWKSAFAYIKQQKQPDDLVVVPNGLLGEYYLRENFIKMDDVDVDSLQSLGNKVWFVEDINVEAKWPQVLTWMQANTVQVAQMDVHVQARTFKMRIYLYDPHNQSPIKNWSVSGKP